MKTEKIIRLDGVLDASHEHGEAFVTEFTELGGFVDEQEIDLLKVLSELSGKHVAVRIVAEEE